MRQLRSLPRADTKVVHLPEGRSRAISATVWGRTGSYTRLEPSTEHADSTPENAESWDQTGDLQSFGLTPSRLSYRG